MEHLNSEHPEYYKSLIDEIITLNNYGIPINEIAENLNLTKKQLMKI